MGALMLMHFRWGPWDGKVEEIPDGTHSFIVPGMLAPQTAIAPESDKLPVTRRLVYRYERSRDPDFDRIDMQFIREEYQ